MAKELAAEEAGAWVRRLRPHDLRGKREHVASVLTPYRSSDGNNPYTEAQLKALWKDLEPQAREPGKYTVEERIKLQRTFLEYIRNGFSATRAVSRMQDLARKEPGSLPYADYAVFMAWKAYDPDFSDSYDVAYAMGTDMLEDKGVEMAYGGNAAMLQFLLRTRNPNRYVPKQEVQPLRGQVDHVHKIELVAAAPVKSVEGTRGREDSPNPLIGNDVVDAEVLE